MQRPKLFVVNHFSRKENGCGINYSELSHFFHQQPFRAFSIKYVVEGSEQYIANGVKYNVNAGEYLLANAQTEGSILVKENQYAKGICIDLSNQLIAEVLAKHAQSDEVDQLIESNFFNSLNFVENKFHANHTLLGQQLKKLSTYFNLHQQSISSFENDFYYQLIELLIKDYTPIYKQVQTIPSKKNETKKDLWRKINEGKHLMDEQFLTSLTIQQIAHHVGLSEYYFFRLFKVIYQTSPYQYILKKRLNYARILVQKKELNMTQIAHESALGDVYSFSKAFKKEFGYSPSFSLHLP